MVDGSGAICRFSNLSSQSFVPYKRRLGCNMHKLVLERVPRSEPSLGSVPGKQEDFPAGAAGTDLPRVFERVDVLLLGSLSCSSSA